MAKDFAKSKCFIKTDNGYEEITYAELLRREEADSSYKGRRFLPLHGMLMEVTPEEYQAFYQEHNHQNYIQRLSIKNGDISYDMLTNEEQNGANILVDSAPDIVEQVEKRIMLDKLRTSLALLSEEELQMLISLFYLEMTERDLAREYQISQVAIHKRKQRILEKLKSRFLSESRTNLLLA